MDRKSRRSILARCEKADKELERIKTLAAARGLDGALDLSSIRIRCPLLSEDMRCLLYRVRPLTCRLYGIPTGANGRIMVCPRSGFERTGHYPAFDLGAAQRLLYGMSLSLPGLGPEAPEKAKLLITVSKALSTPLEDLLAGRL